MCVRCRPLNRPCTFARTTVPHAYDPGQRFEELGVAPNLTRYLKGHALTIPAPYDPSIEAEEHAGDEGLEEDKDATAA